MQTSLQILAQADPVFLAINPHYKELRVWGDAVRRFHSNVVPEGELLLTYDQYDVPCHDDTDPQVLEKMAR